MKVCVLSDARLPTNPAFPGHGLGAIVHAVATGLAAKGHDVTLFGAAGSVFECGKLITATNEVDFLEHDLSQYECVMDNTHSKITSGKRAIKAIRVSHDREHDPGTNAVFPTIAHRDWFGSNGRIIYNGVKLPDMNRYNPHRVSGLYIAWLGAFHPQKQPIAALEAARLAGVKLLMAGTTPPAPPPGARYIGPLWGQEKLDFLYYADALIYPGTVEAGTVTVLEAQSVGTPVIVSEMGGAHENMLPDKTGLTGRDIEDFARAIQSIGKIDHAACRQWIADCRNEQAMIDQYEALLVRVAGGE